jgi:hypothetical protein
MAKPRQALPYVQRPLFGDRKRDLGGRKVHFKGFFGRRAGADRPLPCKPKNEREMNRRFGRRSAALS